MRRTKTEAASRRRVASCVLAAISCTGLFLGGLCGCASRAAAVRSDVSQAASAAPAPVVEGAQPAPAEGFFSAAQVERGRASFAASCDACHAPSEFRGADFEWRWRRQSAWQLYDAIASTMPENDPGGLPSDTYADIVAYLLSLNDYRAGDEELPPEREALEAIALGSGAPKSRTSG